MYRKLIIVPFLLAIVVGCTATGFSFDPVVSRSDTLTIATFNVRIRTDSDKGVRSWQQRRNHVAALIHRNSFDVVGVQELIDEDQEKELTTRMASYSVYSKGRDNTEGTKGERLAIYYLKDRYKCLQEGYFFLSETPDIASKGWDAALNRICQWVELQDKVTDKRFFVFNTHFDHVGKVARANSAHLITEKIKLIAGDKKVLLLGDFNASPADTSVYTVLSSALFDSRRVAISKTEPSIGTFNGWNTGVSNFAENVRIDYVFTSFDDSIIEYRVINDTYSEGAYPSDHFPVMIRLKAR